jgi:hypothetical protein
MRILGLCIALMAGLGVWTPGHAATAASASAEKGPDARLLEITGAAGKLRATFHSRVIGEQATAVPVDDLGTSFEAGPLIRTRLRPGLLWSTERTIAPFYARAEFEADLHEGTVSSAPTLFGDGYPGTDTDESYVRKAALTLSLGGMLNLTGGFMTSHWGLGLIANDGAHGWTPGSADFVAEVGGDRVLRAMLSVVPMRELGIAVAASYDEVVDDDVLLDGDEAQQWVGALLYGMNKPNTAGVYVVSRHQESQGGAVTDALVFDAMAKMKLDLGALTVHLQGEGAVIMGETTLGPNPTHERHELFSMGGVLRAGLGLETWGVWLDAAFASGDQNLDDGSVNAFKSDPNFQQGMILHRVVMAAQTARAPHTASDPELVGVPSEDLERVPTRGAFTNTLSIFPRVWWRPLGGVELYGGALVAFAPAGVVDPLQTRFAGGVPANATGGSGGSMLGTELDLGLRWTIDEGGAGLSAGVEGGIFLPGDAFEDREGQAMEPVSAVRLILSGRI